MKEPNIILVHHFNRAYYNNVKKLRKNLRKNNCIVVKTYQSELEKNVYAGAGLEFKDLFIFDNYSLVLVLDTIKLAAEVAGFSFLGKEVIGMINKVKSSKDVLLIHEIERINNFPLHICFAINSSVKDKEVNKAVLKIPETIKQIQAVTSRYKNDEILVINYSLAENKWDIKALEILRRNHGSSSLTICRTTKGFGHALKKDVPDTPYSNYWEYLNNIEPTTTIRSNNSTSNPNNSSWSSNNSSDKNNH